MDVWIGWFPCLGYVYACCRREQWQTLIISPKRTRLAQARCVSARVVAQATRTRFERADVSLRRRGSRLSEIAQGPLSSLSSSRLGGGELA